MVASVTFSLKSFDTTMNNIVKYSNGFIEGISLGKNQFIRNLGISTINALYEFIDSNARMDRTALHHVYEWYKTGSPAARLFDLDYKVTDFGLSISSNFKQSKTVAQGSNVPFYDKAKIMENGIPVIIKPKNKFLVFEINGETVFTTNDVTVQDPGGANVQGSFEKTFNTFMLGYFKQSFLRASGLYDYLSRPTLYKQNIVSGSKSGKDIGVKTGYQWISNAKAGI